MKKNKNIIFIGGIHGVGKGTICENIADNNNVIHLSASKILKWKDISSTHNKLVNDLDSTQKRLINGLNSVIIEKNIYLLDGHYCLINSKGILEKIAEKTFELIDPQIIAIVIEEVEKIHERLIIRDGVNYSIPFLRDFQNMEINYAGQTHTLMSRTFNKYF